MKEDVKKSRIIPSGLLQNLFSDLESLDNVLNPRRMHVCYVADSTGAGKSSLINSIVKKETC